MRYMIFFKASDETMRVSQKTGEIAIKAKAVNGVVEIKGGLYDTAMFDRIVPITKDHGFNVDYVETQQRAELANYEERKYLESKGQLPQLSNAN